MKCISFLYHNSLKKVKKLKFKYIIKKYIKSFNSNYFKIKQKYKKDKYLYSFN